MTRTHEEECEVCPSHSGMEARNRGIQVMLGILITVVIAIGGTQFMILLDLKSQIGGYTYRFTAAEESDKATVARLSGLEQRLQTVEARLNALKP